MRLASAEEGFLQSFSMFSSECKLDSDLTYFC